MKVGILGGSFDPVHFGHVHISLQAIKRLGLQQVWWVMTKQNPLKKIAHYSINERLKIAAHKIKQYRKIKVIFTKEEGTYNELKFLKGKYPSYKFIWIMGIDNVTNFHRWHKWQYINDLVPFVIFNRNQCIYQAMKSHFIIRFIQNHCDIYSLSYEKQFTIMRGCNCFISSTMVRSLI